MVMVSVDLMNGHQLHDGCSRLRAPSRNWWRGSGDAPAAAAAAPAANGSATAAVAGGNTASSSIADWNIEVDIEPPPNAIMWTMPEDWTDPPPSEQWAGAEKELEFSRVWRRYLEHAVQLGMPRPVVARWNADMRSRSADVRTSLLGVLKNILDRYNLVFTIVDK